MKTKNFQTLLYALIVMLVSCCAHSATLLPSQRGVRPGWGQATVGAERAAQLSFTCAAATPSTAGAYPSRPIRIILGFPPGGSDDYLARIIGPKLSERMGQSVVVENRPGASSNIGAELTARATPDGYTLFLGPITTLAASRTLYPKLGYDLLKDFAYVTLVATQTNVLVAHPSLPAKSLPELVKFVRSKPGSVRYASQAMASGSHLAMELLKRQAGIDLLHVPYKGGGPAATAIAAGEVEVGFIALSAAVPMIEAKRFNALAVSSPRRLQALPNVPTVAESGFPGFRATANFGVLAPKDTPFSITRRLNSEIQTILRMDDVRAKFALQGMEAEGSTPEEFRASTEASAAQSARIIKEAKITLD
ncbi:MAG: Bug family tripartite tricarboxylate transporter substrate binding protein [Burkholderiales bacterium]